VTPEEAERLKWAKYCEALVTLIDAGRMPNASARAAFASLAKSLREGLEPWRDLPGPPQSRRRP